MTEPIKHASWAPRIAALAKLLVGNMTALQIECAARDKLGWTETLTANVLAAGEGSLFWCHGDKWRRSTNYAPPAAPETEVPGRCLTDRNCQHCLGRFEPIRGTQVFCSRACRAAKLRARARAAA